LCITRFSHPPPFPVFKILAEYSTLAFRCAKIFSAFDLKFSGVFTAVGALPHIVGFAPGLFSFLPLLFIANAMRS
jgi:hypothetical protein